jgi:membrane associated rhomboid family serine protease
MYLLCYFTALGPSIRGETLTRVNAFRQIVGFEHRPGWCEMISTKVLHGQVWRLITSQYLHSPQLTHLLFNMLGLFLLGQELERAWGPKKFLGVYTTAGVCGNLLLMAAGIVGWIPATTPALGASGSVLGLLGAAAVLFPEAEIFIYFMFIRIRTAAVLYAIMYLYNIQVRGKNYGGDICHLAGLAFGAWWAWRGDRWWGRRSLGRGWRWPALPRWKKAGPAEPEVWSGVGKGPWGRKVRERVADQQTVDRILAKVYEQGGIGALTPDERRTLREATERLQEAERRAEGDAAR